MNMLKNKNQRNNWKIIKPFKQQKKKIVKKRIIN